MCRIQQCFCCCDLRQGSFTSAVYTMVNLILYFINNKLVFQLRMWIAKASLIVIPTLMLLLCDILLGCKNEGLGLLFTSKRREKLLSKTPEFSGSLLEFHMGFPESENSAFLLQITYLLKSSSIGWGDLRRSYPGTAGTGF